MLRVLPSSFERVLQQNRLQVFLVGGKMRNIAAKMKLVLQQC